MRISPKIKAGLSHYSVKEQGVVHFTTLTAIGEKVMKVIGYPRHDRAAIEQGVVFALAASVLCYALLSLRFLVSSTLVVFIIYAVVGVLWICFQVGIGVYVGYWTKRPGWLMGSVPALKWYGASLVVIWLLVRPPTPLALAIMAIPASFGALGGFIGQQIRSRNSTS
jgi:hypothetical protein